MSSQVLTLGSQIAVILIMVVLSALINRFLRAPIEGEAELSALLDAQREQNRHLSRHTMRELQSAADRIQDERHRPAPQPLSVRIVVSPIPARSPRIHHGANMTQHHQVRPANLQQQVAVKCK
jgi:hypothetical protein